MHNGRFDRIDLVYDLVLQIDVALAERRKQWHNRIEMGIEFVCWSVNEIFQIASVRVSSVT